MAADANVDTSIVFAKFKHYVEIQALNFFEASSRHRTVIGACISQ